MNIPTNLKHKPVIISENYDSVDGKYASDSDAKGLSLGLAQWNRGRKIDISAKIWRHTGDKWSRQSEEMPLHRVLDLAIIICKTKLYFKKSYDAIEDDDKYPNYPKLNEIIPLQEKSLNITTCSNNEHIEEDIMTFKKCLKEDDEFLNERFKLLSILLKELD